MQIENVFERVALDSARNFIRINTFTNQAYFYKLQGVLSENREISDDCGKCLKVFLETEHVHMADLWMFEEIKNVQSLVENYKDNHGTALIYRRIEDSHMIWSRLDFMIPSYHGPENPDIFIYGHDLDSEESSFFGAYSQYAARIPKIVKINFDNDNVFVIQEPHSESITYEKLPDLSYEEMVFYISSHYIHPDHARDFRTYFSKNVIRQHFSSGNDEFFFFCRRKIAGVYHWVKYLILPVRDPEDQSESYYYYIEDIHKESMVILDASNLQDYKKFYRKSKNDINSYYQNMLAVLHGLTDQFVDFYMVDLERDLYIRYKIMSGTLKQNIPVIGSYSESSIDYIEKHCTGVQAEMLRQYCTSDKLKEAMMDCITLEYEFYSDNGVKLRTICRKHESINGIPTKLICHTIVCEDEKKLKIKTFGNFQVMKADGTLITFARKQSKQLLAYLVDHQGYLVTNKDIVRDILEKPQDDLNAKKYCSTLIRRAINDLEKEGYKDVILKEAKGVRINMDAVDCDYYHLLNGDTSYLMLYHNEYMKEYSWAESTNAEILSMFDK